MSESTAPAYVVTNYDGDRSCVVYATTRGKAKAEGAHELEIEFRDVGSCRREKHWDTHDPTIANLLAHGWHWECYACYHTVYDEGCATCDTGSAVIYGEHVYCSEACRDEGRGQIAAMNERNRQADAMRAECATRSGT